MKQRLLLIDGIGPFFRHVDQERINWSKIPFAEIETSDGIKPEVLDSVPNDFRTLIREAKSQGYNAVTLDDAAHLIPCADYPANLSSKIKAYRKLFRVLLRIATDEEIDVYLTTDVMFFNETLAQIIGRSREKVNQWLKESLRELLNDFPTIAGIITRFGESDGVDVRGDFHSELWLRKASDARQMLQALLPVFENAERLLIFRTWSVGANPIGDLAFSSDRYQQVFGQINSPSLVVSLKYGETDFFRYLRVNPLFFESDHKKIVEFQARREYEGFGAYPSFIGWDAEQHLRELQAATNLVGMSVWAQTGGWGKRRQLTFIRDSSVWVELNAYALARLWRGVDCEQIIRDFAAAKLPQADARMLVEFLRHSDIVIKDLLYVRELAQRRLYFRRLRLPPQIFVFWDRILIDPMIKKVLRSLVRDRQAALDQGRKAMSQLEKMIEIAHKHHLPAEGLKLQLATFQIISLAREYYFGDDPTTLDRITALRDEYEQSFDESYSVTINHAGRPVDRLPIGWILPLMIRKRRRYRILDHVVTIRMLGALYPIAKKFRHRLGPKFAQEQAMGLEVLLK